MVQEENHDKKLMPKKSSKKDQKITKEDDQPNLGRVFPQCPHDVIKRVNFCQRQDIDSRKYVWDVDTDTISPNIVKYITAEFALSLKECTPFQIGGNFNIFKGIFKPSLHFHDGLFSAEFDLENEKHSQTLDSMIPLPDFDEVCLFHWLFTMSNTFLEKVNEGVEFIRNRQLSLERAYTISLSLEGVRWYSESEKTDVERCMDDYQKKLSDSTDSLWLMKRENIATNDKFIADIKKNFDVIVLTEFLEKINEVESNWMEQIIFETVDRIVYMANESSNILMYVPKDETRKCYHEEIKA